MSDVVACILFTIVIWFFGSIVILQALTRKKSGGELWKIYNEISIDLGLTVKEEVSAGYGLPDLVGDIKGRRVIIHPIVGKGAGGLTKTAFIVEHKIKINGKIMIASKEISPLLLGKFRYPLDVSSLNTKSNEYQVTSDKKNNEQILNSLFNNNVSTDFENIVSKDKKKFLSLMLESGIVILYTIDLEEKKDVLKDTLLQLVELTKQMENNTPILDPNIENNIFRIVSKNMGYSKSLDVFMSTIIGIVGVILIGLAFGSSIDLVGTLFILNMGVVIILVSTTRIYAAIKMKE